MSPTRLRECLAILSLSQRGLAPILGCTDRTTRHWAAGSRPIPEKIAAWLEEWVKVRTEHPDPMPPADCGNAMHAIDREDAERPTNAPRKPPF